MNRLLKALLAIAACFTVLCCCVVPALANEPPKTPDDLMGIIVEEQTLDGVDSGSMTVQVTGYIVLHEDTGPDEPGGPGGPSGPGGSGSTGTGKPPQTGDSISALYWCIIAVLLGDMLLLIHALANNERKKTVLVASGRIEQSP